MVKVKIPEELAQFKLTAQPSLTSAEDWLFKEWWRFASWMPFQLRVLLDCIIPSGVKFKGSAGLPQLPNWPAVLNQLNLGSCVDNTVATLLKWDAVKEGDASPQDLSRLFLYWNARGGTAVDSGSSLKASLDGSNKFGACLETLWPYDVSQFAMRPPDAAWTAALAHKGSSYYRLIDLNDMMACLDQGYPFGICFGVFDNFYALNATTYLLTIPGGTEAFHGGHCVVVCDYDLKRKVFICQNSWGTGWANGGFFEMTFEMMADPLYVWDAWTIRSVSNP